MSEVLDTQEQETERAERPVSHGDVISEISEPLHREVAVSLAEGDGRTLVSRLVPYNEVAVVDDGRGPYKERFVPGAFNAQLRAADKIKAFLNYRHRQGIGDQIGHARQIMDRTDGLHGELKVLDTATGETALQLYHAGVLDRLSIEFVSRKHRLVDGVVERLDARLVGIALVPEGAYTGAQVLAVREEPEESEQVDETLLPLDLDPELVARLRAQGIALPDRYSAHPAETGTPDETGTPEDGTRPISQTTSSEEQT